MAGFASADRAVSYTPGAVLPSPRTGDQRVSEALINSCLCSSICQNTLSCSMASVFRSLRALRSPRPSSGLRPSSPSVQELHPLGHQVRRRRPPSIARSRCQAGQGPHE